MVRRLKRDLRALGSGHFPERRVVELALEHETASWPARLATAPASARHVGEEPERRELELSHMLAEYTRSMRPDKRAAGASSS
jgi:hypothetical protein